MSFEQELAELMVDTITVAHVGSRNTYGEETYGTPTSVSCRLVRKHRSVRTAEGQEVVSTAHAYLAGVHGVTVTDRVTLPDGSSPPILAVEQYPDEDGAHHEVVYFR